MHLLGWHLMLLMLLWMSLVLAGKDKIVKKRPIAVTDPWSVRSLEDWINLGEMILKKSCVAANLCQTGSILTLSRRLFQFYNELSSAQGMRVYLLVGILLTLFYLRYVERWWKDSLTGLYPVLALDSEYVPAPVLRGGCFLLYTLQGYILPSFSWQYLIYFGSI